MVINFQCVRWMRCLNQFLAGHWQQLFLGDPTIPLMVRFQSRQRISQYKPTLKSAKNRVLCRDDFTQKTNVMGGAGFHFDIFCVQWK